MILYVMMYISKGIGKTFTQGWVFFNIRRIFLVGRAMSSSLTLF